MIKIWKTTIEIFSFVLLLNFGNDISSMFLLFY